MPLIVLQKKKSMTTIRTCVVIINRYTIKYNIIKILKIELQIYDRMIKITETTENVVIFAGENFAKMLARHFMWG